MSNSPTMFDNAAKLYEYLSVNADKDGVYKGTKTGAYSALGLSQNHYTPLYSALEEMGCIESIHVGGRGRRIHLRLVKEPTLEEFSRVWLEKDLTKRVAAATLLSRVEAVERRLPDLNLTDALLNFELRIKKLENLLLDKSKGGV